MILLSLQTISSTLQSESTVEPRLHLTGLCPEGARRDMLSLVIISAACRAKTHSGLLSRSKEVDNGPTIIEVIIKTIVTHALTYLIMG